MARAYPGQRARTSIATRPSSRGALRGAREASFARGGAVSIGAVESGLMATARAADGPRGGLRSETIRTS